MSEEIPKYMQSYIRRFRNRTLDIDPSKNILNGQELEFSDDNIMGWIEEAWHMINEREPTSSYSLEGFPRTSLLLDGAMMTMMEARGLLHLRNQISYSDAGFSVNLDDKSGHYAQWLSTKATVFLRDLSEFKRSRVPRFRGLHSPMRRW